MWRYVRTFGGILLLILGIPGMLDDLTKWRDWLAVASTFISNLTGGGPLSVVLVILGIGLRLTGIPRTTWAKVVPFISVDVASQQPTANMYVEDTARLIQLLQRLTAARNEGTELLSNLKAQPPIDIHSRSDFHRHQQNEQDVEIWAGKTGAIIWNEISSFESKFFHNCPKESLPKRLECHLDRLDKIIQRAVPAEKGIRPGQAVWILPLLREIAVTALLNRQLYDETQVRQLQNDFTIWESKTTDALNRLGTPESDVSYFGTLGTFQPAGLPGLNTAHADMRKTLAEKLRRLDEIARRLEVGR